MRSIGHFIGGKEVKGTSGRTADVFEPMTGDVQAKVALASKAEVRAAVENALLAQPEWGNGASCFRGQNTDGRPACWNVTIGRKFAGQALQGLRSVGLPVRTIPLTRTGLQEWGQAALGDLRQVAALAGIDTASAS